MLKPKNLLMTVKNRRGATAVIVAICLFMLMGFAALAIDVGYLYTTRNELQNVADAAALAGAGYLGSVYETLSYSQQQGYTFNRDDVVNAVNGVANKNKAAGVNITINDDIGAGDIVIGNWNGSSVDPTLTEPNAVRVTARRDSSINNPVSTFFARIFKIFWTDFDTVNVGAIATAALTGPANVDEGELKTPFGLSQNAFPNCTNTITFSPTTESCAGWHNFFDQANASNMAQKFFDLIEGDNSSCEQCDGLSSGHDWLEANFDLNQTPDEEVTPAASAGDTFEFQGGSIASLFNGAVLGDTYDGNTAPGGYTDPSANPKIPAPFFALFDYFRYRDDDTGFTHPDSGQNYNKDDIWTATIPVYEDDPESCSNPSGTTKIVGFATIKVIMPNPPPDKTVTVYIDCNLHVIEGRGGGGLFGNTRGTIPNLVE